MHRRMLINNSPVGYIVPQWPAPHHVRAYTTTRQGGVSQAPYASFNLAHHVGDESAAVQANRARLMHMLHLPNVPLWLDQVHGTQVIDAAQALSHAAPSPQADGAYTDQANRVCAVLTADCLPLLLCDSAGTQVAAVHVGWRGLAAGVVEATLAALKRPAAQLLAWMGPAIGAQAFEVGEEVRTLFLARDSAAAQAFQPSPNQRWLADLYLLTRLRLNAQGVTAIYGGEYCTFNDALRFYSYRREGVTGRMATLIWMETVASG